MAEKKKNYSKAQADELVRKNMIETQLMVANQAQEIAVLKKQLEQKTGELANLKKREKLVTRALVLADRKAKYIETTMRTRCAIEVDNLMRFSEKWHEFFDDLSAKYAPEDKEELEKFDEEIKLMIDSISDIKNAATALTETEIAYKAEASRIKSKPKSVDDRFRQLCNEFDMKVGENATRKPGRPKKNTGNKKVDEIIDELEYGKIETKPKKQRQLISSVVNKKIAKVSNVPKTEDSIFDFDEALNPTEDLETILSELLKDDE